VEKKSPKNYPKEFPDCKHCSIVIEGNISSGISITNRVVWYWLLKACKVWGVAEQGSEEFTIS
jgi:hypothetical protein